MQHNIQKISLISEKESAKVFLAGETDGSKLYILKEIYGEDLTALYHQLTQLPSAFLPEIYDISFHNNTTILLEEYIEGKTLAEHLKHAKLSFAQMISVMEQLCSALVPLHNSNPPIVHRDIKPENIILTPEGNIKLIDLDAARLHKEDMDHDTHLIGTRGYASPEQFGFSQTDARSDIYSMGILLQEMSGHCDCPPASEKRIKKIIDTATMFDPEKRYHNIMEFQKELRKAKKEKPVLLLPCIFMGLCIIALLCAVIYLSGRETTIFNYTKAAAPEPREIVTKSDLATAFTAQCPTEGLLVYLGHPTTVESLFNELSTLSSLDFSEASFYSSDTETITVENNRIIGWKEGTAVIRCVDKQENLLGEWTVSATTFNDGKDPRSYKSPDSSYIRAVKARTAIHTNLELASEKINTLCDMVDFFYALNMTHENQELPPLECPDWFCAHSAITALDRRQTNAIEVINLAAALLQYDYEDSGIILTLGNGFSFLNWYYEDGFYYCIDYYELLYNLSSGQSVSYPIYQFADLEQLEQFAKNNRVTAASFYLAIVMVSMDNHPFMPSHYLSYMRSTLDKYTGPLQLGYEEAVYDSLRVLYLNDAYDLEIISIPASEIPESIPVYGER